MFTPMGAQGKSNRNEGKIKNQVSRTIVFKGNVLTPRQGLAIYILCISKSILDLSIEFTSFLIANSKHKF